uniref:Cathepsin B n=1 Tax=Riptortus pedestris TaxID=329032 RepID=R4WCQ8_RIPPE|nr:cathepsin B [Riptortus pedestris]
MILYWLVGGLIGCVYSATINPVGFDGIIEYVNSIQTTWKAGHNLAQQVDNKAVNYLAGLLESEEKLPIREKHTIPDSEIPEEFDARKQWHNCHSIGHIRDQGNCASCWAVAGAGSLTDRLCIASNGSFTMPLSDVEVIACAFPYGGLGCRGGTERAAWDYFANHGIVTGGDYGSKIGCQPYEHEPCEHHMDAGELPSCAKLPLLPTPQCHSKCTNPSYLATFEDDHHKIKSTYMLDNNVKEIQKEILTHGPLVTGFQLYEDFVTYKSGVYQHVAGKLLGRHGVRVIGWGTEDGTPYWLVANSWNTHWGDAGYFKFIRGTNDCGFEESVVGGVPLVQ